MRTGVRSDGIVSRVGRVGRDMVMSVNALLRAASVMLSWR